MAPNAAADIVTVDDIAEPGKGVIDTRSTKEKKPKKVETDVLPHQDHGYAWVVVFAMFLYNVTLSGTYKSFGVLYVGLIDLFRAGEFQTSLVTVVFSVCSCLGSMVTGSLCDKFPLRNIVVVGAVIAAVGFAISAFATNIYLVIFGYGILAGFASSCFDSPLMCSMALYWNKRKSLANGLGYSGTSAGTLILPLLYTLLIEEYTVRGALLLAGGIWLHIAIGGMLLRPPPSYKTKNKIKECPRQIPNETVLSVDELTESKDLPGYIASKSETHQKSLQIDDQYPGIINKAFIVDETSGLSVTIEKQIEASACNEKISQISPIVENKESQNNTTRRNRTVSTSESQGYREIFTNLAFIRLLLMIGLASFSAFPLLFIMPSLALEWGASDVTASLTITVSGATELLTRMSMGYFIDRFHINKIQLWSTANLVMGLTGVAVAYSGQVTAVILMGAMMGMCGTIMTPMMVPIMSECIPAALMGRASGLVLFMFGVGPAVGYAVAGQLSETTGSYVSATTLFSFVYFFVSAIGFTEAINSVMQKIFKKLCSQPKDNDCKVEDICDNKEIGAIVEEEPEYNIQTVINQDFISTWL